MVLTAWSPEVIVCTSAGKVESHQHQAPGPQSGTAVLPMRQEAKWSLSDTEMFRGKTQLAKITEEGER